MHPMKILLLSNNLSAIKKYFWEKNQADHVWLLIWPEWKNERESQKIRHQKATSSFCRELLLNPLYEFGDRTKGRKNEPTDGFRHSLLE